MTRLLYVTSNSTLGGTSSSLNSILRGLRPAGLSPVMLFREPGPWQNELQSEGIPCYFDSLEPPNKRHPVRDLLRLRRLVQLVKRERIDLIHCNEVESYPLMKYVGRWTRRPVMATLHFIIEPGYGHWAFRRPYMPAALQFISRAQLELCRNALPSDFEPERLKLLMSGMQIEDFIARGRDCDDLRTTWGAPTGTVIVGTASSIKAHKRLDDFVQLIGMLRSKNLPVLGVIAGGGKYTDPAYESQLRNMIRERGLEQHCRLVGFLNPVTPFMKAIDIFVMTSQWETLSMSLCEAMACGKPALAYAVGGNPETVHDPWCVAPFPELDTLTGRVEQLVVDRALRECMGAAAAVHVRAQFDGPALAARQAAIYEQVLGRPVVSHSPSHLPASAVAVA